ncbi:MAG: DsbA family protein [Pseudomonadota bacterium]
MTTVNGFDPLRSDDSPVIVYFDLKSPYAFIAKDPIRALERELDMSFDWRPLTLNIQSYLGSARLDKKGKVASANRSQSQWGAVKYAYRDARRYAELQGYTLRGTEKIWNTELIHMACGWVKAHQPDALERLLDLAYPPFWQRDLDVESFAVVAELLRRAGAPVDGFAEFVAGPGPAQHAEEQAAIFAAGIFGVPTVVFEGNFWFGREHLPALRHRVRADSGPVPAPSNTSLFGDPGRSPALIAKEAGKDPAPFAPVQDLEIHIDVHEAQSYLGLEATLALLARSGRTARWLPFEAPAAPQPFPAPAATAAEDRGSWHRYHRNGYRIRVLEEQASARSLDISSRHTTPPVVAFNRALLWLGRQEIAADPGPFLRAAFHAYWEAGADLSDHKLINQLLADHGLPAMSWETDSRSSAAALTETLAVTRGLGAPEGPRFILDGEPFSGATHLPLVEARLTAR